MKKFVVIVYGKTFSDIFAFCEDEEKLSEVLSRVSNSSIYQGYEVYEMIER